MSVCLGISRAASEVVTITIPSGKKFSVHAHLLAYHSDYFLAALNSPTIEATTLQFYLTEYADEKSMGIFLFWIYSEIFAHNYADWKLDNRFLCYSGKDEFTDRQLVRAWQLGDYLQAREFTRDMLEVFMDHHNTLSNTGNPLLSWPKAELETLDPKGDMFRLFAAMMAKALYEWGDYSRASECLKLLSVEARNVVTEFMARRSLKMSEDFTRASRNRPYEQVESLEQAKDCLREMASIAERRDYWGHCIRCSLKNDWEENEMEGSEMES